MGRKAVVTDAHKAPGEGMEKEAVDELHCREAHGAPEGFPCR